MIYPRRTEKGFSLLEIVIVVAIGLVLIAFAVPVIQSSLRNYSLGGAASNVTRMMQMTRYTAVRQGSDACTLSQGGTTFGVDEDCDGAIGATETTFIVLPNGVSLSNQGPAPAGMSFPAAPVAEPPPFAITFTPRGTKTTPPAASMIYLTGWGNTYAVTVSGAGRARSWRWIGGAWQ